MSVQRPGVRDARVAEAIGLSRARLAWLQVTHRRGWAAALWLCLVAAVAMPALLPLIGSMSVESQLDDTLSRFGGVTVTQATPDFDAYASFQRAVDAKTAAGTGNALVALGGSATAGPLTLSSVDSAPAPPPVSAAALTAAFSDDLAQHVIVNAGEIPPEALGGGDTAVTMPQAGADQLGLRLSDRVCGSFGGASGSSQWCGRIVGLWRPIDASDPFWSGRPPRLELTMGRYDFFQLMRLHPPQPAQATLRYWADPEAVNLDRAPTVANQVHGLVAALRQPGRAVATTLDVDLGRFAQRERAISAAIQLLGASVTLLGVFVVALVGARFLDGQARELAILRARGWPRRRIWRVVAAGLAALTVCAMPVGLVLSALVLLGLGLTGTGLSPRFLQPEDVIIAVVTLVVSAAALVAGLAVMAARMASHEVEPSLESPFRARPAAPPAGLSVLGLIVVGLPALFLPRLPGVDQVSAAAPQWASEVIALAPAVGLVLLTGAAVRLYPLSWATPGRRGVGRALAGWQLERRPEQHAGAAFVLIVAAAIAVFAALGAATAYTPDQLTGEPALREGMQSALVLGALAGLVLALAAYGLHFRSTTRRRLREYGGLFAHGLPPAQLARSLAAEQVATARASLLVGSLLGLALALVVLPLPGPSPQVMAVAIAAIGVAALSLLAGSLIVGSMARRLPSRVNPIGQP